VLLQHGADPNLKAHFENTPLSEACWHGHPKMLKHFIAAKGDLEATNNSGYTLLSVAAHRGQDECVRVLIDAGVNLEARGWGHKRLE
jgi:ankyrin repeat protein